ncbi:eukaryotic translation initiation factor 3 subunit D-like [Oryzias latipes]|uniref:eukaryotic translation initiation factor 3 subunit D-like n=1 Tax=Oryzias latipes TaxID=8090 RepID=UPI0002A4BB0E|nr:eukaryotic translation initiation factor 3 subunit D-like [Oryzias latipes]
MNELRSENQQFSFHHEAEIPRFSQHKAHQYCKGVDWRQKLDSQRGAVLATELKNNSYKLARWTCCAMLAGSEYLKLGYVSRYHVKDSARHVILGTQHFKPNEFASQINLSMENTWGILRRNLDEGKYLILKDPNKMRPRAQTRRGGATGRWTHTLSFL